MEAPLSYIDSADAAMTRTENGALTYLDSGDANVDFFFKTVRTLPEDEFRGLFLAILNKSVEDAFVLLMHMRDVRFGKGEIRMFKWALRQLAAADEYHAVTIRVMELIPDYGCFLDLMAFDGTSLQAQMIQLYAMRLKADVAINAATLTNAPLGAARISLAAKWAPREGKKYHKTAMMIAKELGLKNAAEYRKFLQPLSRQIASIETTLSANEYDKIAFSRVPSKAMHRYNEAFTRHAADSYAEYLKAVRGGTAKMNTRAIEPHVILKPYIEGKPEDSAIEAGWTAFVSRCRNEYPHLRGFLPVIDVSGSMSGTPLIVAVTLGMLLAECNEGALNNRWVTFSTMPKLGTIRGDTVRDRVNSVKRGEWDGSTNISATFDLILANNELRPHTIVIFSDMEFNEADSQTNFEDIRSKYRAAEIMMPKLVFWNLQAKSSCGAVPVRCDEDGTALISGFSPALFKLFVECGDVTPRRFVQKVLADERYAPVRAAVRAAMHAVVHTTASI